MKQPLFSRSTWNRGWLYDSGLALGTLDALVLGNGVDQALRDAGWSPESGFAAGLLSMGLVGLVCVASLRVLDVHAPDQLPTLCDVRNQFRLFTLPAAVVFPWLGVFIGLRVALDWLPVSVAVGSAFVLANVASLLSCWFLASRQQRGCDPALRSRSRSSGGSP